MDTAVYATAADAGGETWSAGRPGLEGRPGLTGLFPYCCSVEVSRAWPIR